ncbi:MAG: PrsW family intramembrane metalloprotease [Paludibacteraceae bacterium]|nr:PrsW family intramembrane metalloprotease [Paludibacteraceae bacterium]
MAKFYVVLAAAVLPAFVLLYYIYRRDKYQREPVSQLLKGFFYGILAAAVAGPIELLIEQLGLVESNSQSFGGCIWDAFFGVALVEEGVKLFFLWLLLRKNKYYDEMMDGVVYAVAVGMGFAAAENVGYLFGNIDTWQQVAVGRAIFSVPGHFMFAVAMGYYYSIVHFTFSTKMEREFVLFVPLVLHGIFDSLLFIANVSASMSGVIWLIFVVFCLTLPSMANKKIKRLLKEDRLWRNSINFNF